jgi:hypothetical protein
LSLSFTGDVTNKTMIYDLEYNPFLRTWKTTESIQTEAAPFSLWNFSSNIVNYILKSE